MVGTIFCGLVCFGIPLISLIYFLRKRNGYVLSFLTGAAVFVLFQMVLRLPLINNVFSTMDWFLIMTATSPILTILFYAFTAGLFEEVGRHLGFISLRKGKTTWMHGLAFGLGHGGVEALWIGSMMFSKLPNVTELNMAVAGFERLCTIGVHTGLTFVVLKGVREKKIRYLVLAILLHTILDFAAPFAGNIWFSEGIIFFCFAAAVIFVMMEKRKLEKN